MKSRKSFLYLQIIFPAVYSAFLFGGVRLPQAGGMIGFVCAVSA